MGRVFPSFLGAVKTFEKKSAWEVFISLKIPLSKKVGMKGRINIAFFPLTTNRLAGENERGGGAKKLSLRPVDIILVTVWSPNFAHWAS